MGSYNKLSEFLAHRVTAKQPSSTYLNLFRHIGNEIAAGDKKLRKRGEELKTAVIVANK